MNLSKLIYILLQVQLIIVTLEICAMEFRFTSKKHDLNVNQDNDIIANNSFREALRLYLKIVDESDSLDELNIRLHYYKNQNPLFKKTKIIMGQLLKFGQPRIKKFIKNISPLNDIETIDRLWTFLQNLEEAQLKHTTITTTQFLLFKKTFISETEVSQEDELEFKLDILSTAKMKTYLRTLLYFSISFCFLFIINLYIEKSVNTIHITVCTLLFFVTLGIINYMYSKYESIIRKDETNKLHFIKKFLMMKLKTIETQLLLSEA